MNAANEEDPEQPLLGQPNSRRANHEVFRQNQQAEAGELMQNQMFCVVGVGVLLFWLIWVAFYCAAVSVYINHSEKSCDQPLAKWLLAMIMFPLFTSWLEIFKFKMLRFLMMFLTTVAIIAGFYIFNQSETCSETNPDLYSFVKLYLIFLAVWCICREVMTCLFVAVVIYGMMHGWFDELNGADPEVIVQLETVAFDPALFAQEGLAGDNRPAPECCICTEAFDTSITIKRTPCQHYFHEECLKKWLKAAKTCPLCRSDLQKTVADAQRMPTDKLPSRSALFNPAFDAELYEGASVPPGNAPGAQNRSAYVPP